MQSVDKIIRDQRLRRLKRLVTNMDGKRKRDPLPIFYKGQPMQKVYRTDFVCFDTIIVEIKALPKVGGREKAQVINYLRASNLDRGLLLNFGTESLQYTRLFNSKKKSDQSAKSVDKNSPNNGS